MESLQRLSKEIETLKNKHDCLIIAVCGAADLGKTYLSTQLVEILRKLGLTSELLTLDSYMIKRAERIKQGISGYQPKAYNFLAIKEDLIKFKNSEAIDFFQYDHSTGQLLFQTQTIYPCDILLIDGLHSMSDEFTSLINFSIFLYTDDKLLKVIRHKADLKKRKQTIEFSNQNYSQEFVEYKKFVEPYKKLADAVLLLEKQWEYTLIMRK